MTAPTDERVVVKRRPRQDQSQSPSTRRSFVAPDDTWQAAMQACHARGVSLGSQLVRALERVAAGETL